MVRYQRPVKDEVDPYKAAPLPVDRPAAVYYRQSTEAQIGNISTTLQTVDLIEHLLKLGWIRENIYMIDMDAGISGSKTIEERPGMSKLYDLIENNTIGLVAAQDVDRFFRDLTMIQTNIFLDACKRKNVQVMTPHMVYDFNHPTMGAYYMKLFRDDAQRAADFLEYHIKGRLRKSREYLVDQGRWAGRTIPLGFMVDMRRKLDDGSANPNWRRFTPCEPIADIVRKYYQMYIEHGFNFKQTYEAIEQQGPFVPENLEEFAPDGFRIASTICNRSRITGQLMPSRSGLRHTFVNAVYIGHWVQRRVIIKWYNHEPIIDEDLFMRVFNSLSDLTLRGERNEKYFAQRTFVRHVYERPDDIPLFRGYVVSDQPDEYDLTHLSTGWNHGGQYYNYILMVKRVSLLTVVAYYIDHPVSEMLRERLLATTIDDEAWSEAMQSNDKDGFSERRRIQSEIKAAERSKQTILVNLKSLANPELVQNLEASYEANQREIERLEAEMEMLQSRSNHTQNLIEARPAIQMIVERWEEVPREQKRALFEAFAHHIIVRKDDDEHRHLVVQWRDGTESLHHFTRRQRKTRLTEAQKDLLKELVEKQVSQVELLRTFPDMQWRQIQRRYAYYFGDGNFIDHYHGEVSYGHQATWYDTEEYQAEAEQSVAQTSVSFYPHHRNRCA